MPELPEVETVRRGLEPAMVGARFTTVIQRLNAAVRMHGLTYSRFIDGLGKAGIEVDRKVLSELAIHEPAAFAAYVEAAKAARPQQAA